MALPALPASASEEVLPTGEASLARLQPIWTPPQRLTQPEANPACAMPIELALPSPQHETSRFGLRLDPLGGGWRMHEGVDLAAPMGSPVVAAGGGKVLRAGWGQGYGNLVIIDHGQGLTTRYAHLERSLVRPGEEVDTGQEIGLIGATGHATGSHLHFEIRLFGRALDPEHADMTCSDVPAMASPLGEVPARTAWTTPADNGQLPTIVLK